LKSSILQTLIKLNSKGFPFVNRTSKKTASYFHAQGKLMLTGEYLVLKGAKAIALPVNLGQSLNVRMKRTFNETLVHWCARDYKERIWFQASFSKGSFEIKSSSNMEQATKLQQMLKSVRALNIHFMREVDLDHYFETRLEFPLNWGLGSSSTLISLLAQLGHVDPFDLMRSCKINGSGYDLACAQSMKPVLFHVEEKSAGWAEVVLDQNLLDNFFLLHLNEKVSSEKEVNRVSSFQVKCNEVKSLVDSINLINDRILEGVDLKEFIQLMKQHESITGSYIGKPLIQELFFSEFDGLIKSLGAWGGDFALVASESMDEDSIREYFNTKGYSTFFKLNDLLIKEGEVSHTSNFLRQ